jgi:hypothetical protein
MKNSTSFLLILLFPALCVAQITGKVNYDNVGISFTIPDNWKGQEGDGMLILGSDITPGFVLVTTHNYTTEQLIQESKNGINMEGGTSLSLSEDLKTLSPNALAGSYKGIMEYQSAEAFVIAISNPTGGPGISIMAATLQHLFSEEHKKACMDLYKSLEFKKVDRSKELNEWKQWLSNVRLTYMDSHYSSAYTEGGISAGYSSKTTIDLCSAGYFNFYSSSNTTFSGDGVSAYGGDKDTGDGSWKIGIGATGNPALILNFQNGEQYTYSLEYSNEELYLDGDRFFRTISGEYAPACN